MNFEPDTIWGRTTAGDEELESARCGLSLGQRRLLALLANPRTFAAFAARHALPAPKLERDLLTLARLQLVAFQHQGAKDVPPEPDFEPSSPMDEIDRPRGPSVIVWGITVGLGILAFVFCMTSH